MDSKKSEKFKQGLAVFQDMVSDLVSGSGNRTPNYAEELGPMSIENVFGGIWTRPELDKRARSLVTLGILIALRAEDELKIHFKIAKKNGLTDKEIKEVIYQASAYAGFPAAAKASHIAAEVFGEEM